MSDIAVSDHLKKHYADYYKDGDSPWRWLGAMDKAANIISLCDSLPHKSVIEIGAGEGSILKKLSEVWLGDEFYAVEISPTGVETIRKKRIPRLIECSIFDGYTTPYDDGRFDLAILSHVIEHVEHPRILLYEAARVARYIFVEVPLEDTVRLKRDFVFDKVGHINFYSAKTIRRLIQSCDLEVIDQKVTNVSKAAYTYMYGRKGIAKYYTKEYTLRLAPRLATAMYTYHSPLVCRLKE